VYSLSGPQSGSREAPAQQIDGLAQAVQISDLFSEEKPQKNGKINICGIIITDFPAVSGRRRGTT
jgi:hypothetical protein